jgi:hypothetical protein
MKIAAFALLLSGVFSVSMIPTAELKAEGGYGAANYHPWQRPANSRVAGYGHTWQQGQPGYGVNSYPASRSAYRFRPWSGARLPTPKSSRYGYPAYNQIYQPVQGYKFRSMPQQQALRQAALAAPAIAYRPANITIPDHYVYRPLNPVKKAKPRFYVNNTPRAHPPFPGYGYTAYQPMPGVHTAELANRQISRAHRTPRYVYGNGLDTRYKFRPDPRIYRTAAHGRPIRGMNSIPGFAYNRWPEPMRFRPTPQFRATHPGYTYPPTNRYPATVHNDPDVDVFYTAPISQSYPNRQKRPEHHVKSQRKQVDWYDGRADGEGAWYKLTEQQHWPEVSQNWAGQNNLYLEGHR